MPDLLCFRPEYDKRGYATVAPINSALRPEIERYLRRAQVIGEGWLFEYGLRPGEPVPKNAADHWLRRAERKAGLDHPYRSGWHSLRRGWATKRKAAPLSDLMLAGGWRDATALQKAYTRADPATVRRVMEG